LLFGKFIFFWQKSIYLSFVYLFVGDDVSLTVGKYGRVVLPKKIRQKYGVDEGVRLIITEFMGCICLVPAKTYGKPTEAIYGAIKLDEPIDDPKHVARDYIRKKLFEDF
jgi:AbrB family looped-hinge helix DNA binding protein